MHADPATRSDAWNDAVPLAHIAKAWVQARSAGLIDTSSTAIVFHDLARMGARLRMLQAAFPANTTHALAIKANPLVKVLRQAVRAGAGLEAASLEELWLARAAHCQTGRILFDSPAKTAEEIDRALALGVWINADNAEELARIDLSMDRHPGYEGRVGLRINPLVGEGSIGITNVGGVRSRFGVPVSDLAAICDFFGRYPWLSGLHVHVGSQGTPLTQLVAAVRVAFDLRRELERRFGRAMAFIDIGGGLPARYVQEADPPTPDAYVSALRQEVPELFDFTGTVLTEFGRAIQASCGWAVSRVEYVKDVGGLETAVLHLGADFLMRPVYRPTEWPHRFHLLDADGIPKTGKRRPVQLVGPLCFAGDVVAESVSLPPVEPGDLVVIADTGAYTLSLWSRHCNRAIPAVIGVSDDDAGVVEMIRARETRDDIVQFWS